MIDSADEFKRSFVKGMERYNVPIRVVDLYSFESLALVKKFKQDLARLIYKIQYAIEGKLKEGNLSLYAMSLGEVIPKLEGGHMHKKTDLWWSLRIYKIKKVIVGKNLSQPVLYYLEDEPIDSTKHLIGHNPKRSFKREELQEIENPKKIEYSPDEFIQKYHPSGSIHFIHVSNNEFDRAQRYARRHDGIILAKTGRINNQNVFLWTCENGLRQFEYSFPLIATKFEWCPLCFHNKNE
ncbi:14429_t:CDS:2 [Cetraspora pellucida]|uniref:14429_t:CDS:1 n=1 Tax=Cetraspora pellucida TaxID=1433469 RepID=A0A9N9CQ88_9GLOM|nr:14429_t:CDS:2 [Cetraspora pellucida]